MKKSLDDSDNSVGKRGFQRKVSDIFQDRLATIFIISIFALIVLMFFIHIWSINYVMSGGKVEGFGEIEGSNQNFFNILLPLFGAWIGTIIAFYYGKENAERAYKSLSEAQKSIDKFVGIGTITKANLAEVIDRNPFCKDVRVAKLSQTVKDVFDRAGDGDVSNVLIVDDNENILGLLYISDIHSFLAKEGVKRATIENRRLADFFNENDVIDNLTKEKWSGKGIKNYIPIAIAETAEDVAKKMLNSQFGLSARGIVTRGKKPYAIITYDMLVIS